MGIEAKKKKRLGVNGVRASQKKRSRSTVEQSIDMKRDRTGSWIEKQRAHLFSGIVRLSRSRGGSLELKSSVPYFTVLHPSVLLHNYAAVMRVLVIYAD